MAEALSSSELSKRQLLLAALRLFADQGIDAVSMRMINREAGAKNNSALHYHFGNKVGVFEALVDFIQEWFELAREESLSLIETANVEMPVDVRRILEGFITPYIRLLSKEEWGYSAVRFLSRMELEGGPDGPLVLNRFATYSISRFKVLFRGALPDLPEKLLMQRFNFLIASVIQGLADHKSLKNSYMGDMSSDLNELAGIYLDFCTAGMSAPVGPASDFD